MVSVGTFNLNDLCSRYNFQGEIQAIAAGHSTVEARYEFTDPTVYRIRTFMGRLVKGKDLQDTARNTARIAARIALMDLDVLAVQEVDAIGMLKRFIIDNSGGLYQPVVSGHGERSSSDRRCGPLEASARCRCREDPEGQEAHAEVARVLAEDEDSREQHSDDMGERDEEESDGTQHWGAR